MHNIYEDSFNYRVGGVYQISEGVYSKILYGTSFKAPASTQLYTNPINTGGVIGNINLKPEKAETFEFNMGGIFASHFNLNFVVFYTRITDKVELITPPGRVANVRADNVAAVKSYGLEAELLFSYKELNSYLNYSGQRSSTSKNSIELDSNLYPEYMFKFGANYKVPSIFLNFNVEGRFIGERIASEKNNFYFNATDETERYSLPSYMTFDFMISSFKLKPIKKMETEIKIKIYNLSDIDYIYPGFNNFDIPGMGRRVHFTLTQYF